MPEDRQELFDYLWKIHTNTETLTSKQILLRDLKIIDGIPLPGVPFLVHNFLQRNDSLEALVEFSIKKESNIVIVIGLEATDNVQRDIGVFFRNKNDILLKFILDELKNSNLDLEEIENDLENLIYFKQNNVKASRKKIIPLVKSAVEKSKIKS